MCGLAGFFARESVPTYTVLDSLFSWSEKRGVDGFGLYINNRDGTDPTVIRRTGRYSDPENKELVQRIVSKTLKIGSLVLAISRAQPETEPATKDASRIQPIMGTFKGSRCVVLHNGAVSNKIYNELKGWVLENNYSYTSNIDSEAILVSYYKYNKNIKDTMEFLSGGFAAIMYDEKKDMLYVINDFKPIAHGYVRGLGFFLASDNDCLSEIIYNYTGMNRDGVFLWESHYHHYLSGNAIREIDLQSGFMRKIKYSPRYIIGTRWDSNFNDK